MILTESKFKISPNADRMGYQLEGVTIVGAKTQELVSTGVSFGTIQLLPNGQLIILMADHQTTGGYARLAHVVSAQLHLLAQMSPGMRLGFQLVGIEEAEQQYIVQQHHLLQLQNACKFRLAEYFS